MNVFFPIRKNVFLKLEITIHLLTLFGSGISSYKTDVKWVVIDPPNLKTIVSMLKLQLCQFEGAKDV